MNSKRIIPLLTLVLAMMLLAAPAEAKRVKAKHVILLGIDAWGAYSVPKATNIPNIKFLMDNGSWTLKKRADMPTESAVNWSAMFNGGCTEMHGYNNWNSRVPALPSMYVNQNGIFPTVYSLIREAYPTAETANMAEWDGIKYLIDSLAVSHIYIAKNYPADKMELCREAVKYIKEKKPMFLAVCWDQLDWTGHHDGHDTPAYYAKLSQLDQQVGLILQAIKDAGIWDDTVIMMTADHGGIGKGHGNFTLAEEEIPFIAYGKCIKRGYNFTDVMMQFDTAATIAEVFGLKRPQAWRGVPIYSIFK